MIYSGSAREKSGGHAGGRVTERQPSQGEVSAKPQLSLILQGAQEHKLCLRACPNFLGTQKGGSHTPVAASSRLTATPERCPGCRRSPGTSALWAFRPSSGDRCSLRKQKPPEARGCSWIPRGGNLDGAQWSKSGHLGSDEEPRGNSSGLQAPDPVCRPPFLAR